MVIFELSVRLSHRVFFRVEICGIVIEEALLVWDELSGGIRSLPLAVLYGAFPM